MCHGALGGAVRVGAHVGLEHQIEGPNCDDEKRQHVKRKTQHKKKKQNKRENGTKKNGKSRCDKKNKTCPSRSPFLHIAAGVPYYFDDVLCIFLILHIFLNLFKISQDQ